jgi:serine protease SohB
MPFWLDIAAFLVKAIIIVAAIGGLVVLIVRLARSSDGSKDREIRVKSINDRYEAMRDALNAELLDKKGRKALAKARKSEAKARRGEPVGKRIYVLTFKGDLRATAVKTLGREIDAVLTVARPASDEVVVRIDSGGGTVTGYGLAAAEILRLRARNIRVTASVDQIAASGGYMMAAAADHIVAAPFAVVGSIGVVASTPNLHRLLKKNDIDYEDITAGAFKRTVTLLGEITPSGREHFQGKIDAIHAAFKAHIAKARPGLDIDRVADGDYWLASEALGLGLVDEIVAGDDLLFRARDDARLYEVRSEARKSPLQQLLSGFGFALQKAAPALALRALRTPESSA